MLFLKLIMRAWRESPFSQFASTLMVSVLLFLMGFLFWVDQGLKPIVNRLKNEQVVTLFLEPGLTPDAETQVMKTAQTRIEDKLGVGQSSVALKLMSQTEFLEELRIHYKELAQELESLGAEMNQMVPRYVSLTGIFRGDLVGVLTGIQGIERIESSRDRFQNTVQAFITLRWIARILIIGLGLALFTGLFHLCKTNGYLQSQALELMRLWGANQFEMKLPGMLSGLLVGAMGGFMSTVALVILGKSLTVQVRNLSPLLQTWAPPSAWIWMGVLVVGLITGLVSGLLSTQRTHVGIRSEG